MATVRLAPNWDERTMCRSTPSIPKIVDKVSLRRQMTLSLSTATSIFCTPPEKSASQPLSCLPLPAGAEWGGVAAAAARRLTASARTTTAEDFVCAAGAVRFCAAVSVRALRFADATQRSNDSDLTVTPLSASRLRASLANLDRGGVRRQPRTQRRHATARCTCHHGECGDTSPAVNSELAVL